MASVVLVAGWVVGHEVVVEVVIAAHSDEEDAAREGASHVVGAEVVRDLIQRRLEVPYLLVERNATHLTIYVDRISKIMKLQCTN